MFFNHTAPVSETPSNNFERRSDGIITQVDTNRPETDTAIILANKLLTPVVQAAGILEQVRFLLALA